MAIKKDISPVSVRLKPEMKAVIDWLCEKETRSISQQMEHLIKTSLTQLALSNPDYNYKFKELGLDLGIVTKGVNCLYEVKSDE